MCDVTSPTLLCFLLLPLSFGATEGKRKGTILIKDNKHVFPGSEIWNTHTQFHASISQNKMTA